MDDRDLDERIASRIDAEYIVKQFGLLDEKQKEELAQDISRFMYDRQADLRSPKNTYTPRFLWQGQDINHADIGRTLAVGHKGPTVPRIINLDTGFNAYLTQNDPQQLNIRSAGAGADCMFDYLVSSCFATLNGFSEGTQYTSLSGCTFYAYSTVQGAATAISALAANQDPVLFICPGTYAENVTFTGPGTNTVTIIGAGRIATQITGQTSAGTTLSHTTSSTTFFILENLRINVHNSAGAIGIGDTGGSSNWLVRNVQVNTSSDASSIGVYTGIPASTTPWRFEGCLFSGSGSGIADAGPGDTGFVWGNVICQNCSFTATTGVWFANDNNFTAINCEFSGTTGIKNTAGQTVDGLKLVRCFFTGCTTGVLASGGGGYRRGQIEACRFEDCDTAINFGTVANASTAFIILGNNFITSTATDIAIDDTSGQLSRAVIIGNTFVGYNANNEMIGLDTTDNEIGHNETDSGATLPDTHSVLLAGTFAPIGSPFVTVGNDATLTAERALVGGSGIDLTDGGANGNATLDLANLTQAWANTGVFDISTVGNLKVIGAAGAAHLAVGTSAAISALEIANLSETFTDPSGSVNGFHLTPSTVVTSSINRVHNSLLIQGSVQGNGFSNTSTHSAINSTLTTGTNHTVGQVNSISSNISIGTAGVASSSRAITVATTVGVGGTITDAYGIYIPVPTGSGSITNAYGLYIESQTKGGTLNRAIYSAGGISVHGGNFTIGGTAAPSTTLDVRGALTLDGVAAPSTPASDDGVLYNETGTDFLKYKEDNAAVYNLTHKHLWDAAVDVTTASTTVPPMLVGPMPNDGTIVSVYAKLTDNKTNGATSSIFDIHKILLANANTDGQGTTIYTTQANRPTISNGNMYQAATAPDVTTFAAGDWFAIYCDQSGSAATFAVVGMWVRYT